MPNSLFFCLCFSLIIIFETATASILTYKPCSEVRVEGLETMDYLDNMKGKERFTEQGDAIVFESEVGVLLHVKYLTINVNT